MFNSKEAEKVTESSFISKTIQPGNCIARITDISLEVPSYDSNAYNLVLSLETQPILDEKFEGFLIDKDNPELGHHAGQVAKVNSSPFSYTDYTTKDGTVLNKEQSIFKWISLFSKEIGVSTAMSEANISGETIEEYVNEAKPFLINNKYYHFCIAGAEYENKAGYIQHRLYLPKLDKGKTYVESYIEGKEPSAKFTVFNPAVHIRKKKTAEAVNSFEGRDASATDLTLD
jgi:hypothetical protein